MAGSLAHVTLDTGHVFQSSRPEAREGSIAIMGASLARALRSSGVLEPIPYQDGYAYLATVERAGLLVTVAHLGTHGPAPVVTFGVAIDDTYADLWALLHRQSREMRGVIHRTEPNDPPQPPWLAVRMEVGATSVPAADLLWMADFERIMAWSWLDHVRAGQR